jgi:hypothetical protein
MYVYTHATRIFRTSSYTNRNPVTAEHMHAYVSACMYTGQSVGTHARMHAQRANTELR